MASIRRVFTVAGQPFFPLGGQVHNSSAYDAAGMEIAWLALKEIGANMVEAPVYWEQLEPQEGVYNFAGVDALLVGARAHGLRVILLWFATWKNGTMKNSPTWVKRDPARFPRACSADGTPLSVLSAHDEATWDADRRAFCALLAHLRERDGAEGTVIAVQVENEPGILGSDRDYSPTAEALFRTEVPATLLQRLADTEGSSVVEAWRRAGGRPNGDWLAVFGDDAGELFTAWSVARFIDRLAEAGKAVYDLPMFANVWLREFRWRVPGVNYPSGGATTSTLDLWKWAAPHLDLIAPDIYMRPSRRYDALCAAYSRPDNPLFVPESQCDESGALNLFAAIADHGAIGYALFGVEDLLGKDGALRPHLRTLADSFRCVSAMLPIILREQERGSLHAVRQEEWASDQFIELANYTGLALFRDGETEFAWSDFRHYWDRQPERGRGLVAQVGPHELYLVGAGYRLMLKPRGLSQRLNSARYANEFFAGRLADYISVEEGHFAEDGTWVVDRRRSGDESDFGVWVEPDVGVVRVILA